MKRIEIIVFLALVSYLVTLTSLNENTLHNRIEVLSQEEYEYELFLDSIMKTEKKLEEEKNSHLVTVTVYNPVSSQCDSDPLITADNSKIDIEKLNSGELKWIAVSRDLREKFPYGTKIRLEGDDSISGIYYVHDTMNPRYSSRIDILSPCNIKYGKWENVKIIREEN